MGSKSWIPRTEMVDLTVQNIIPGLFVGLCAERESHGLNSTVELGFAIM